jgi:hypothetical protein
VEWYPWGWIAADDGRRRSARPATHGVAGRPGPQSVQQKRPGPCVAQQSVSLGAEILEGLPEREGEPQVGQIPRDLWGWLARCHSTCSGESGSNGEDCGARLTKKI